ncbi:hypothetical protein M427DRAFT_41042 [Gonapodya prolifera JEL478]|uniref:Uncharacterized protein n=1 Tax=Gonapodya prolifera (strain JEL478) TaxID=1344416 RepID=A0A139AVP2_GONPJ|nr:hypothetical protein M427DRAFT_41042 [Gonapodya prolifera JEL478]|eukprot:KXS20800.1 hypothetical protein M427DRAFT_41042 [Gonapodya prolifera JEL478]
MPSAKLSPSTAPIPPQPFFLSAKYRTHFPHLDPNRIQAETPTQPTLPLASTRPPPPDNSALPAPAAVAVAERAERPEKEKNESDGKEQAVGTGTGEDGPTKSAAYLRVLAEREAALRARRERPPGPRDYWQGAAAEAGAGMAKKAVERMRDARRRDTKRREEEILFLVEGQVSSFDALKLKELLTPTCENSGCKVAQSLTRQERIRVEELLEK